MEQIKIGTCIPGQQAEQWLPGMKDKGFECFAINFHMTYSGIDLKELAPKVMGMLEGTGTYVSTVGYYCNALQNESQLHDLEYAIDNAHLFGAKTVATFAGALEGQSIDAAIPRFKEVFSELAKRAEDRGVKLAIENCPMHGDWRHATCNIGINPDAWELMFDAVPSDALGLEWEPAHQLIQLIDPMWLDGLVFLPLIMLGIEYLVDDGRRLNYIIPLALMVLTATGYFYTTLRLSGRWIETVYLVIVWNLLYQTVLRGLSVAARRIAYRRAIARRQHQVKEGAEGAEPQEEPTIALEQVNQQTLRITMLVMIALFAVMFWAIWSDLITVFAYLDSITLWQYNGTEAGAAVMKSVTMGSLLFALVSSVVAWALIRNLPGLLEVLVLSRLNMRQGTSYAITTILNYAIIAIGAMTVFGALGVSWDKLQWLAAALSVGLGFGLQEIFGNFVSGLIILFERPVRIGDTVTIGTFSGTVSKIRIRATTITDFDRKEVIIPNKAFVTERLINWSLSDTVTRVVIRLGVAYGSDLDKVKEVLLKAASEHPKVMHDPAPAVFFTTFGPSTLDHELRLYVRELRDRSYTVDELNRSIDRLCRENDINIAFNQLEVHLRNEKGDEHTEVKRDIKGDDPTPA